MPVCRICKNEEKNKKYSVKEMMLGLRESFEYFECQSCGCVQISTFPENLDNFYPDEYYSFSSKPKVFDPGIVRHIKNHRFRYHFTKNDLIGFIVSKVSKTPVFYQYFKIAGIKPDSKILDVGCGFGKLLLWMKREGFTNIAGIDPFIKETIRYSNGLIIQKKELHEMGEQFDFIMLHHSFEHMTDPVKILQELHRLIEPSGTILIRIPIASYAWHTFGADWVALDAPRHFYLHTLESMRILAANTGYQITNVVFDSFEMQFWGSIQYQKNIPLMDQMSYLKNKKNSIFSEKEIKGFKNRSKQLNKDQQGDAAGFYLRKT